MKLKDTNQASTDETTGIDAAIVREAEGTDFFGSSGLYCSSEECYIGASELQAEVSLSLEASVWGSAA